MFESKKFVFLLALVVFTGVMIPRAQAQGNLLVTPRRVVFDGSSRVMELNLANTGRDTARYNISFIQYRMTEEGAFEEITEPDPGQFFADNHLRTSRRHHPVMHRAVSNARGFGPSLIGQVCKSPMRAAGMFRLPWCITDGL